MSRGTGGKFPQRSAASSRNILGSLLPERDSWQNANLSRLLRRQSSFSRGDKQAAGGDESAPHMVTWSRLRFGVCPYIHLVRGAVNCHDVKNGLMNMQKTLSTPTYYECGR